MSRVNHPTAIAAALGLIAMSVQAGEYIYEPLWGVDDEAAIAGSVAIDGLHVWGAWRQEGARLSAYPIADDGSAAFEFISLGAGSHTGVAAAKGTERVMFLESAQSNDQYKLHAFTAQRDGAPDWTFEFPEEMSGLQVSFRHVAISHDGSTAAAIVRDGSAFQFVLHIFDAATGEVSMTWSDPGVMTAVELTDDGSQVLLTQWNRATLIDAESGEVVFQTPGSGSGSLHYRVSGNGSVIVVGGSDLTVYRFDGEAYQSVIEYTQPGSWFGLASVVSRDGSTVGALRSNSEAIENEAIIFDVDSGKMLGSYLFSGTGENTPTAQHAVSSDDGSVMAFASWGTEHQDWPEITVFNRDAELIGAIEFPGSAFSVDISADGRYVVGGAKAVHANTKGTGGRIEVIALPPPEDGIFMDQFEHRPE